MANLGYVSSFNINGNELSLKDAALTEIVEEIIEAIGANNGDISERINNLHERSFDALIKISSQNESEIERIQDGMYKLQYVTITGEGDNAVETLNNSAILIQKGTNQYLYKDGQISNRTKTDSTWGNWITFEGGVTSVNGQTGAVTITHPVTSVNGQTGAVIVNVPVTSVNGQTGAVNITIPTKTSDLTNDSNFTTLSEVQTEIVGAAPEQLNTLAELADALNDDQNFASTVTNLIGQKYTKPNTGIPASDLADGVIPDVPVISVNGMTGAVVIPEGGVTSFNGATGAITYSAPVTSVNGMTGVVTISQVQADWHATSGTSKILNKPDIFSTSSDNSTYIGINSNHISIGNHISIENNTGVIDINDIKIFDSDSTSYIQIGDGNKTLSFATSYININGSPLLTTETETQLSKGTATGSGNAVTDINVSNHQITLVKGATYVTQSDIDTSIAALVDSAPGTLDTLNELAAALGDDPNFATTIAGQIGTKYTKPNTGIPSTDLANDVQTNLTLASTALQSFTETDPTVPNHVKNITSQDITNWNNKLSSTPVTSVNGQTGAVSLALGDTNVIETVKVNNTALTPVSKAVNITVPTKVSDLTNDSNFTSNVGTITGITMNGVSKGTNGVVDLGTVLTEHQDISGKVDKVTGMGLSSNDYTTTEKNKLAGINIGSLDSLTTTELNSIFS